MKLKFSYILDFTTYLLDVSNLISFNPSWFMSVLKNTAKEFFHKHREALKLSISFVEHLSWS